MLELTTLIGKGNERLCYQHPNLPDKCVKITFNQKKSNRNESEVEFKYCQRLLKINSSVEGIPIAFAHEWVNTDQGLGLLCDLIKDFDGQVSKSLHHYRSEGLLATDEIDKGLAILLAGLIKYAVSITYVHDRNILVQYVNENEYRLILIDGLGNSNIIPLGYWFKSYARKQTARRFLKRYKDVQISD
jgi:hypothetical protein